MRVVAVVAALLFTIPVFTHESRPAYLEVEETASNSYEVFFKQPRSPQINLKPSFDVECQASVVRRTEDESAIYEQYKLQCETPLALSTVFIEGLTGTLSEVLFRFVSPRGEYIAVIHANKPSTQIDLGSNRATLSYFLLGAKHLLFGWDHLAFLLCLLYLSGKFWTLVKLVTAFTVAHSTTLIAASLTQIQFPVATVEFLIAFTILALVFGYLVVHGDLVETKMLWLVVFVFGLIHGCGFASILGDVGLPQEHVVYALLLFNVGIEVGQIAVIATGLGLLHFVVPMLPKIPAWIQHVPLYGLAGLSSYWIALRFLPIVFPI